mmetsp:Transcript_18347/g.37052  ORF Transcript_18347/g.37052 Transcript_18347/m.37052 type:complete len:142 (-) Transcript_18347:1084-1509(-)
MDRYGGNGDSIRSNIVGSDNPSTGFGPTGIHESSILRFVIGPPSSTSHDALGTTKPNQTEDGVESQHEAVEGDDSHHAEGKFAEFGYEFELDSSEMGSYGTDGIGCERGGIVPGADVGGAVGDDYHVTSAFDGAEPGGYDY